MKNSRNWDFGVDPPVPLSSVLSSHSGITSLGKTKTNTSGGDGVKCWSIHKFYRGWGVFCLSTAFALVSHTVHIIWLLPLCKKTVCEGVYTLFLYFFAPWCIFYFFSCHISVTICRHIICFLLHKAFICCCCSLANM